jgi:hypothetical protein
MAPQGRRKALCPPENTTIWVLQSNLVLQRRFADAEDRLVFIASDRELKEAAQSSGFAIIDPEEQEQQTTSPGEEAQEEDKS